jgi:hypothetical protein
MALRGTGPSATAGATRDLEDLAKAITVAAVGLADMRGAARKTCAS